MPKFYAAQTNFVGGSINEDLLGRTELGFYANSVREMINAHTIPQGGLIRAPGSERLGDAATNAARLIPWILSTNEAYVVEVAGTSSITQIRVISGMTAVVTFAVSFAGAPETIRYVQRGEALIMFLRGKVVRLFRAPTGNIALQDVGFLVAPNDELGDPDDKASASNPTFTVTGTTLTTTVNYFRPADVGRQFSMGEGLATVATFVSATEVTLTISSPFVPTSATWDSSANPKLLDSPLSNITLAANKTVVGDTQTLTASTGTWKAYADGYAQTDIGRYVQINGGLIEITGVTSATVATGVIRRALDNTNEAFAGGWRLRMALIQAGPNKPHSGENINAVTIFESRLVLGGFSSFPSRVYCSRTGEINDFSTGINADDAFQFDIDSSRADQIVNLATQRALLVFTLSAEYAISGSDSGPIKPLSTKIELATAHGSAQVPTIAIDTDELFVQRGGQKIRAYGYSNDAGEAVSPDVTIRRSDLFEGTSVKRMAYSQSPHQVMFALGADGKVRMLCIDKPAGVYAWSDLSVENVVDIASIPEEGADRCYMIIQRGSELLIERFRYDHLMWGSREITSVSKVLTVPQPDGDELDLILFNTFYGVWTYEGKATVSGGEIEVQKDGLYQVGYNAQCKITLLPVEAEIDGSLQGRRSSYNSIRVRCYRTNPALKVAGETMQFRNLESPSSPPVLVGLFTGDAHATLKGWADNQPVVSLIMDAPLEFRLVSIVRVITVND